MKLSNKRIMIVGAKLSGMAAARLAVCLGAREVRVSEFGPLCRVAEEFRQWADEHGVILEFEGHTREFIEASDVLVVSPGVRADAIPIQWARSKGILVLGEIEFASQFCSKPIIAVTGSNGKTTVTTLIDQVLKAAGYQSCLCGNIGRPFSDYVLDLKDADFVVLEVSSFQLEILCNSNAVSTDIKRFKPYVSVFLNFSQNHLDRHKDMDEYFLAKARIFCNQDQEDFAVLNYAQPRIRNLASAIDAKEVFFDSDEHKENPNYLAVMAVAKIFEIDLAVCKNVFQEFPGVEHRLEKVRVLDDVEFINDSKSTTAVATQWAFNRIKHPVLWICGGRDKNIDFTILRDMVTGKVKRIFTIGEAAAKIQKTFQGLVDIEICDDLKVAVFRASANSSVGDCVLFSPMCASFDMFHNFEERGRVFKDIVNKLGRDEVK